MGKRGAWVSALLATGWDIDGPIAKPAWELVGHLGNLKILEPSTTYAMATDMPQMSNSQASGAQNRQKKGPKGGLGRALLEGQIRRTDPA